MSEMRVMQDIRRALGRAAPLSSAPVPPEIAEHIVRLVHSDIGLPELFVRMARQNQMLVEMVRPEQVVERLCISLQSNGCKRIALSNTALFDRLGMAESMRAGGFEVMQWTDMSLDELYDFDCGITDVRFAVTETGSLVIQGSPQHGRALSLVPAMHIAIAEPKNLLADLVDLFEILARDPHSANPVIITGPSKTADIEMNLVTGVHGPGVVQVLMLR